MRFIGVFQDGNFIDRPRLEDITAVPRIKYILKIDRSINSIGHSNETSYELIESDGRKNILRIGDFELLEIGTIFHDSFSKTQYVYALIYDCRIEKTYKFRLTANPYSFVQKELLPMFENLIEFGSCVAYLVKVENDKLKLDIEGLKRRIIDLERNLSTDSA